MKQLAKYIANIGLTGFFVLTLIACSGGNKTVQSPNSKISFNFMLDNNQPKYTVDHADKMVLDTSQLGVVRDGINFAGDMRLESVSGPNYITDNYSLLHGKQTAISYTANETVFHLRHTSGQPMDVIVRVSDDGIGFRYHFPGDSEQRHQITKEHTSFNFSVDGRAWLQPLANVNTGFAQTNPSYEEHYKQNISVGTPAPDSAGWAYPALFKSDNTWIVISETGMDGTYPATRLQQESTDGNYTIGFPQEGEQFPGKALDPQSNLPWTTPWRIIAMGDLETITESTLGTDLADPAVDMDTGWIKPGRASWSWAKLKDPSVNYEDQKRFIDYAADMGWEYTLVDVNWDQNIGYDRMAELADYAASKNVGLFLWYNSSGSWNDTEFTPKSALLTHEDRVKEFSRLQKMGIKGIKVDFFAGDGQSMMQYYIDIFEDAANHHLLVNTHGTTLPRGWHRTYPNLMTMESIKGFEFITFEQANADQAANHNAMLPFTRNLFSPMDYTPMSPAPLFNAERRTTKAHEIALPVLFTSGIQHYAETAERINEITPAVKDFIKTIPVAWDEMEFVGGFPGEEVVIARRAGDDWFVAGINGEQTSKELTLDLSFINSVQKGDLIADGSSALEYQAGAISSSKSVSVPMKPNGGFIIYFSSE